MELKDLVIGEYYYNNAFDAGQYIFIYEISKDSYSPLAANIKYHIYIDDLTSIIQFWKSSAYMTDMELTKGLRLATLEERNWLNACIASGVLVERELINVKLDLNKINFLIDSI